MKLNLVCMIIFDNACYLGGKSHLTLEYNYANGSAFIQNNTDSALDVWTVIIDDDSILSKATGILNFENGTYTFNDNSNNLDAKAQKQQHKLKLKIIIIIG